MFLAYLQDLKNHFGKTCVIMDKATQHTAKGVMEYAEKERGLHNLSSSRHAGSEHH